MLLPSAAARYSTRSPRPSSSDSRILASFTSRSHSGYDSKSTATSKQRSAGASMRMRSLAVSVIATPPCVGPGRERAVECAVERRGTRAATSARAPRTRWPTPSPRRPRPRAATTARSWPAHLVRRRAREEEQVRHRHVVAAGRPNHRQAERVEPDRQRDEKETERGDRREPVERVRPAASGTIVTTKMPNVTYDARTMAPAAHEIRGYRQRGPTAERSPRATTARSATSRS